MELAGLAQLVQAVIAWWRRPLDGSVPPQRSTGPSATSMVFCEFCSDWHPRNNCAGSWP